MAKTEHLTVGGSSMELYVDAPKAAGPHPGVVVTHHRGGIDAFTKKFVEDLAAAGYVAAAPLLFHRRPADEDRTQSMAAFDDKEIIADIGAAVSYLQGRPDVRADAIGIVGHCMGGRCSFLGAATSKAIRACAIFYGGNIFKPWGAGNPAAIERAGGIACPVIGFFGNDDQNPSPDDVTRIGETLSKHGVAHTFHRYDGAGHAFQNFLNQAGYREEATRDAQKKMLAFFAGELEPVAA